MVAIRLKSLEELGAHSSQIDELYAQMRAKKAEKKEEKAEDDTPFKLANEPSVLFVLFYL